MLLKILKFVSPPKMLDTMQSCRRKFKLVRTIFMKVFQKNFHQKDKTACDFHGFQIRCSPFKNSMTNDYRSRVIMSIKEFENVFLEVSMYNHICFEYA